MAERSPLPGTTIPLPSRLDREWALAEGAALKQRAGREDLVLDFARVESVESAAAATLALARARARDAGRRLALKAPRPEILERLRSLEAVPEPSDARPRPAPPFLESVGAQGVSVVESAQAAGQLLAGVARATWRMVRRTDRSYPGATIHQLMVLGISGLPIVLLLQTLIGLTLALLMGNQLASYGASVHLATMMGVSYVREIGPLLTAVIIAGRSGSAITAELGSMCVQEEIDALKAMGATPVEFLVLPRLVAMLLAMPVLVLCADLAGILSGLFIAVFKLSMSPAIYLRMLRDAVEISDVVQTLTKSLVFAAIITLIASHVGLHVRGGSDAVGRATTQTVVQSIFWVIVANCIFALIIYL